MRLHETRWNQPRVRQLVLLLVQLSLLGLFIALHLAGATKVWLFVLIAGFIASLFVGRLYCRVACPVNTFNRIAALLPGGIRLRIGKGPVWLTHPVFRVAWFSILLATLVSAMILGLRFHLFTIITLIGIILCRVFPAAWCNGLCPWGALLQCGSRLSLFLRKACQKTLHRGGRNQPVPVDEARHGVGEPTGQRPA